MTDEPQPTERDLANAAARDAIADRQRREYRQVLAWADRIMGPGWLPVGRHYLVDKEEEDRSRRTGERAVAAATVFTVTNGASKRHFTVQEGRPVECSGCEDGFGTMLLEAHPTLVIEVRGEKVHPHRFSLCWAGYELYEPRSAEDLAALRASRERGKRERADAKERIDNPLFTTWAERNAQEAGLEGGEGRVSP